MTMNSRARRAVAALTCLVCILAVARSSAQESSLITASYNGDLQRVKALLAAKANVNAKSSDETTALMAACQQGHLEVVRELLAAGQKKST